MKQKAKEAGTLPDGRYIQAGEVFDWGSPLDWADKAEADAQNDLRGHPTMGEPMPKPEPNPNTPEPRPNQPGPDQPDRSGGKPTPKR